MTARPSPYELWQQASGDRDRYRQLLREHGHLVPLKPGETAQPLPCGWPTRRASGPCCDMHNANCEPPGDLCCHQCTEAAHDTFPIRHADGSVCVLDQQEHR